MKIIKIDPKNPMVDYYYDYLDNIFHFLYNYLPFLFTKKCVTKEGLEIRMPYYVTQREINGLSNNAKKLANELNWNKNETIQIRVNRKRTKR